MIVSFCQVKESIFISQTASIDYLSSRGLFLCLHSLISTQLGVGRIGDSYTNLRRSGGNFCF